MREIVCLLFFCITARFTACSQDALDDAFIRRQLEINAKAHPFNLLFVHTDKTLYTNNETIWFSGYLLRAEPYFGEHSIVSVALVSADNRQVALRKKYLMKNGQSSGSLSLPDTVPPGN
jgi:hypothetical protein